MRFGHNFWPGALLTQGQRIFTSFYKIFSGIPHFTIFGGPKYAPIQGQIGQMSYLGRIFQHAKYGQGGYPWKDLL